MSFSAFDEHMMSIALTLARRGLGATAPNPSVGAVIADERTGELIARAVTQPGGRPHAEPQALQNAGARARDATLYVTLEPCAHHGKTPPCADAIIAAGVRRVVVGIEDPDPRTQGQGVARLRDAGIKVQSGLLADEARWVSRGHILRVTANRPFVTLKMALTANGEVPHGKDGQARFVTGEEARAMAHRLRAESDAILVGSWTVRDDDPELTCRLPGLLQRSPVRVVLSRSLDLAPGCKLLTTARDIPVWIFASEKAEGERIAAAEAAGARVFTVAESGDGVSVRAVLERLAEQGITRLLVEGGETIWRSFAAPRLVDEVALFQAGGEQRGELSSAMLARRYVPGLDLGSVVRRAVGADTLSMFRVVDLPRADVGRSA